MKELSKRLHKVRVESAKQFKEFAEEQVWLEFKRRQLSEAHDWARLLAGKRKGPRRRTPP